MPQRHGSLRTGLDASCAVALRGPSPASPSGLVKGFDKALTRARLALCGPSLLNTQRSGLDASCAVALRGPSPASPSGLVKGFDKALTRARLALGGPSLLNTQRSGLPLSSSVTKRVMLRSARAHHI